MSEFVPRGADGHVLQKLWVWSPETIEDNLPKWKQIFDELFG